MKTSRGQSSHQLVLEARRLRREMTPTEKKLWQALRSRRLAGLKFRRQHPYAPYILDFYCPRWGLVVELDGAFHDDPQQAAHDSERTEFLNTQGIRVIRFSNEEVDRDLPQVLRRIYAAARTTPTEL